MTLSPFSLWKRVRDRKQQSRVLADFESEMFHLEVFLLIILLASGIASVGILQNNVAVLIGAMLITPLVNPFVGIALGMVVQSGKVFRMSLVRAVLGTMFFWGLAFAMGKMLTLPGQPVPQIFPSLAIGLPEILLAIFAGLVAAIAIASEKIYNLISGAAIAIALAPPLAMSGIALAMGHEAVFLHGLKLFGINAAGLVVMGLVVFLIFGFRKPEPENPLTGHSTDLIFPRVDDPVLVLGIRGHRDARIFSFSECLNFWIFPGGLPNEKNFRIVLILYKILLPECQIGVGELLGEGPAVSLAGEPVWDLKSIFHKKQKIKIRKQAPPKSWRLIFSKRIFYRGPDQKNLDYFFIWQKRRLYFLNRLCPQRTYFFFRKRGFGRTPFQVFLHLTRL
ncbi:MAG: DUF389 domain-containing protein [Candidatus Gracilibacteria bacterium]|nr:DUF389 domain-containing protein [Candidatus Gracilibacteria bacterium]